MNDVAISGRLTRKPKTHMVNNSPVCNFTIALNEFSRSNSTTYANCVAWGKIAENLAQYQDKGDLIEVSGFLFSQRQEINNKTFDNVKVGCNSIIYIAKKERKERQDPKKKLDSQEQAISENSVDFSYSLEK